MELTVADRPVRRLTAGEVVQMVEAGILSEGERAELLHGVLTEVMTPGFEHSTVQSRLLAWLGAGASAGDYVLRAGSAVLVADPYSLPEPDIALVAVEAAAIRPHPRATLLAIEIALASLRVDLRVKRLLYADAGFPEYWVIDVKGRCLRVFTEPLNGDYLTGTVLRPGDRARPRQVDLPPLEIAELLDGLDA